MTCFSDLPDEILLCLPESFIHEAGDILQAAEWKGLRTLACLDRRCYRLFHLLKWKRVVLKPHKIDDFLSKIKMIINEPRIAKLVHECIVQVIVDPTCIDGGGIDLTTAISKEIDILSVLKDALNVSSLRETLPKELLLQTRPSSRLAFLVAAAILQMGNLRNLVLGGDYLGVEGAWLCLMERYSFAEYDRNPRLTIFQDGGLHAIWDSSKCASILKGVARLTIYDYRSPHNYSETLLQDTGPDPIFDTEGHPVPCEHNWTITLDTQSSSICVKASRSRALPLTWLDRVVPDLHTFSFAFTSFRYVKIILDRQHNGGLIQKLRNMQRGRYARHSLNLLANLYHHKHSLRDLSLTYDAATKGEVMDGLVQFQTLTYVNFVHLQRIEIASPLIFDLHELKDAVTGPQSLGLRVQSNVLGPDFDPATSKRRLINLLPRSLEGLRLTSCAQQSAAARLNVAVVEALKAHALSRLRTISFSGCIESGSEPDSTPAMTEHVPELRDCIAFAQDAGIRTSTEWTFL